MRRVLTGTIAAVIAAVLVLAFVPAAYAVDPLPPAVDPIPALPSTYNRTIATGSGQLFQDQIAFNLYVRQQMAAQRAAAATVTDVVAVKAAQGVPVTGVRALSGATGGVLTGAFMAGWMITDGTLAMYGHATGNEPMAGTCNQPDWAIATIQVLYPFSAPSCASTIDYPNLGVEVTYGPLTYNGGSVSYTGPTVSGASGYCYTRSSSTWTPGSGYSTGWINSSTGSKVSAFPSFGVNSRCASASTLTGRLDPQSGWSIAPALIVYRVSDGVVVASMSQTSADPDRTPSCQLTWPGGEVTTVEGNPYKESEGFPVGAVSALCNDGFVSKPGHGPDLLPSEIEIGSTRQDTDEYTEVQTAPVPEFTPDEKKGLTPGTSSGGLVLQRVVGTVVRSCMTWDVSCVGWWPATGEGTDPVVSDGYYRCLFNGSPVPLTECSPYRTTFDTPTANPTITDPNTGTTSPWTSGSPGTQTGSSTFPSTGTAAAPVVTPVVTGGGGCALAWSWNPVDWVLNPLRCAFIPSTTAVSTAQATTTSAWTASKPGQLATAIGAVSPALAALNDGSCGGLILPTPKVGAGWSVTTENRALLAACPGDFFAPWAPTFYWFITFSILIAGFFAVKRMLDRFVGFGD